MYNIIVMDSVIIILLPYMYTYVFIQILMSAVKEQMAALKHVQILMEALHMELWMYM